jgi:hypothetical protein
MLCVDGGSDKDDLHNEYTTTTYSMFIRVLHKFGRAFDWVGGLGLL